MNTEPTMESIEMVKVFADADFNCRGRIAPLDVMDLMKDIEDKGLIQPVCVRPMTKDDPKRSEGYEFKLIAGFRRHMCHKILKKATILAVIRSDMGDELRARSFNLVENLQRADLTILQEAKAIEHLHKLGLGARAIGKEIGMSLGWVQVRVMLLNLPIEVQAEVVSCSISQTGIRDLFTINQSSGKEACFEAVKSIKAQKARGKKSVIVKPATKPKNKTRSRSGVEVKEFLAIVQASVGNSFATRCLAWCAGAIDDMSVHKDLARVAEEAGTEYKVPEMTL